MATDPRVLESLRALTGMGMSSNAQNPSGAVMGRVNQQDRLDEMKRNISKQGQGFSTGALPFDVQNLQGDLNSDSDFGTAEQGRIGHIQDMNNAASDYARPELVARRAHDEATKLQLAGEPARVAGAANLASANAAGEQKYRALQEMLAMGGGGGRTTISGVGSIGPDPSIVQGQKDAAASARIDQTANARSLTDEKAKLEGGKAHAPNSNWFGFGQKAADDARIAEIQRQLLAGGQDSEAPRPSQASTSGPQEGAIEPIAGHPGTEKTFRGGKWIRTK